MFEGTIRVL